MCRSLGKHKMAVYLETNRDESGMSSSHNAAIFSITHKKIQLKGLHLSRAGSIVINSCNNYNLRFQHLRYHKFSVKLH